MPVEEDSGNLYKKLILVIVGALIGALAKGGADYFLQDQKHHVEMDLAQKKFESELIIKTFETLSSPQGLNNLNFLIKAGLIKDSEGKILQAAKDYTPKFDPPSGQINNKKSLVESQESKGFQALLSKDLSGAKKLFESAYITYPTYHNVDEISNKLLRGKTSVSNWETEIYCPIVKQYSWGMPKELKTQMAKKGNCK